MALAKMRSLTDLEAAYPQGLSVAQIANLIGGKVGDNLRNPDMPEYKDTCAIRVSRSLNYGGAPIGKTTIARFNYGSDKRRYVYSVSDLRKYLTATYGPPTVVLDESPSAVKLAFRRGIIEFWNYHMDLWKNDHCVGHAYFEAVTKVQVWETPDSMEDAKRLKDAAQKLIDLGARFIPGD